jgi:hypothetical protein
MDTLVQIVLPAGFGALVQELAYWWQLRFKLDAPAYQRQMRSWLYWLIVVLMIFGSAAGTAIWFSGEHVSAKDAMIIGASFPLLFKHAVGVSATSRARLGADRPGAPGAGVIASYFKAV